MFMTMKPTSLDVGPNIAGNEMDSLTKGRDAYQFESYTTLPTLTKAKKFIE